MICKLLVRAHSFVRTHMRVRIFVCDRVRQHGCESVDVQNCYWAHTPAHVRPHTHIRFARAAKITAHRQFGDLCYKSTNSHTCPLFLGSAQLRADSLKLVMPCPFTGPKMFWAGPNVLCQTKNLLFTYCGSHKRFVPDKKMFCIL